MSKIEQYKKLVQDIQNCHCCENIKVPVYESKGEFLSNVDKNKYPEMEHVNMWNYWQGNLDADIMMIGQDYGIFPKKDCELAEKQKNNPRYYSFDKCVSGSAWINDEKSAYEYWGTTDSNVWKLFHNNFGIDVSKKNEKLFFTNIACCYRQELISGNSNFRQEWVTLCANKFMSRLVHIIEPKIIIVLGENAFHAFSCLEDSELTCTLPNDGRINSKDSKFERIMRYTYTLCFRNGYSVRVFPVYHPGAYSTVNRPMTQMDVIIRNNRSKQPKDKDACQMSDWKNIANYYNQIK